MKRLLRLLPLLILSSILTACGNEEVTYRTLDKIKESGTINIAFSVDMYPFMNNETISEEGTVVKNSDAIYKQEEQLIGSFAKRNGVKVNLIRTSRDELINMILDGSADIALGRVEKSESDKFKVNQSLIYAKDELYVITAKNVTVMSIHDLKDKKVAIIKETPMGESAKSSFSSIASDIKEYKNLDIAVEQLLSYNIDAIVCYKAEAMNIVAKNSTVLEVNTLTDSESLNYVGLIAKNNDKLLEELNNVINEYFYPTSVEEEI